jgi:trimethylamine--corrinoid protein Co-methyltransferase
LRNPFPPLQSLSEHQLQVLHRDTMRLLSGHGLKVLNARARALFARAGAIVDQGEQLVRADESLIMAALRSAPRTFSVIPRNPDNALPIGGNAINFGFVSGPPNVHCRLKGRRAGNFEDYRNLIRLAQYFNVIHTLGGQCCAPMDLPANTRHLDIYHANLTLTDKSFLASSIGAGRVSDALHMVAIAKGMTVQDMKNEPAFMTVFNVNSPRLLDEPLTDGLMAMAEYRQPVIVTPFTLMGAMTPVTLTAAMVQQNAEALLTIALTQLVNPGAPVVYGAFTSNVDMKSGAPAFGTPENARANIIGGQLARHYGLPYRSSNCNAANTVDAQATYESMMSLWSAILAHSNIVLHGAGWMEGGLVASYEKVVLDVEMLQNLAAFLAPATPDADEDVVAAIAAVAPGGHFFGTDHTMARYETAFHVPLLSDWQNHGAWEEQGSRSATERATALWQRALQEYEEPSLDPARREALDAYVIRRKEEIGSGEP